MQYTKLHLFYYGYLRPVLETAQRVLTIVALWLFIGTLLLLKQCTTPQQLPPGIGTPPLEAPPQSMPPHNAPKSF